MTLQNIPEFTVSEFSRNLKQVVMSAFGYVRIRGEISGFKKASSGHLYFSLKDDQALLSAVCFKRSAAGIDFAIADGLEVIAQGEITTYEGRSSYQIVIEKLEIAGIGALLEAIEQRRKKLLAEGLFDAIHKKPIPFFPSLIGIITSPTGAVIEDIKHRITERCPTHLMLYPALVQGLKSAEEIIAGIMYFNRLANPPAVIIIARGGGSFEDLLPFNDEALVRAVFASTIPIISAVGHETDTTLIDYVCDLRAPTPTAAAEIVTPVLAELKANAEDLAKRLRVLAIGALENRSRNVTMLAKSIPTPTKFVDQVKERLVTAEKRVKLALTNYFKSRRQRFLSIQISPNLIITKIDSQSRELKHFATNLENAMMHYLKHKSTALDNLAKLLKNSHYQEILKRGFAIIKDNSGQLIKSATLASKASEITVEMADGEFVASPDHQTLNLK